MIGAYITSAIRTGVPLAVGWLVAWLLAHGIDVPAQARDWAVGGLTFAAAFGYYLAVRALEHKWPQVGVLLGVPIKPVYPPAIDPPSGNTAVSGVNVRTTVSNWTPPAPSATPPATPPTTTPGA